MSINQILQTTQKAQKRKASEMAGNNSQYPLAEESVAEEAVNQQASPIQQQNSNSPPVKKKKNWKYW